MNARAALVLLVCLLGFGDARAAEPETRAHTKFITSPDGVRIAYETHGHGPVTLVFIHGWSCDRSYWSAQLPVFAKKYRVVAMDLGGHGESGLNRQDWSIASFANDVVSLVWKLRLQRVILIGHSMGGDVAAEAARHLEDHVVGVVWLDTYKELGVGRTPESVDVFVKRLEPNFQESVRTLVRGMFLPSSDSTLVERVATDMAAAPPAVALSSVRSSLSYSRQISATLEELKLPVIAINPDNAPTDVESMKQHGVDVVIMPGVGHFLMMEDPRRLNDLLGAAVERLSAP